MGHRSKLTLNLVPLGIETTMKIHFHRRRDGDDDIPVQITKEMSERHAGSTLYTNFSTEKGDLTLDLSFTEVPKLAIRYLTRKLVEWFKTRREIRMIRADKRGTLRLGILKEKRNEQQVGVFDWFQLRGEFGNCTEGFECTVIYDGVKQVWLRPVYEYPGETTDIRTVAYQRSLHNYRYLMESGIADRREVYPVINTRIREVLELPDYHPRPTNRVQAFTEKIDAFYERFMLTDSFREEFQPDRDGYHNLPENKVYRLPVSSADLKFGEGVTARDPLEGLKTGGPFQPPKIPFLQLFMVLHEQCVQPLGERLCNALKFGSGAFPGLPVFARMPVHFSDDPILFGDHENPVPEIRRSLQKLELDEQIRYGAVYISPIAKKDSDPKRHAVYYRVKEELLKYGITSQAIHRDSILKEDFDEYLPNIAAALIAKLGGVPWTLKEELSDELLIGLGIHSPYKLPNRPLGSTFSFTRSGEFIGFDSYEAGDKLKLTGSILKAIREFRGRNGTVKRVVIHLNQQTSNKIFHTLQREISAVEPDVFIVILTIQDGYCNDRILSDRSVSHRLPLSGTWMRVGGNRFLLSNNTRYGLSDDSIRSFPFPVTVTIDIAKNHHKEESREEYRKRLEKKIEQEGWVEELLRQVYQFSRLNWKSVSLSTTPITLTYPEMVARRFPYFKSETLSDFGKRNLWFL